MSVFPPATSGAASPPPERARSDFKGDLAVIVGLSLATLLLHVLADSNYGYFRDELYFLACGRHLAWGYGDQPPLIAAIAEFSRWLLGDSLRAIRFFPALAGAAIASLLWWLLTRNRSQVTALTVRAEADKERTSQGYPSLLLTGWAEPPHYDSGTHKLYWALNLKSGDATENTLNYKIRVLGRKGVLVLNAVAGMNQLPLIKGEMQKVIGFADFTPGNRYADFNSSTDKVAEYGVAALVAGAVAAKVGLFAKLFAVLIAAKKLVVVGFLALVAGVRKLLGLKKKESPAE